MVKPSIVLSSVAAAVTIIVIIATAMIFNFNIPPPIKISEESPNGKNFTGGLGLKVPVPIPSGSSPYIKEYDLPRKEIWPNGIAVDENNTIWFIGTKSNSLFNFKIDESAGSSRGIFEEFYIPDNSSGNSIIMGWDVAIDNKEGIIWFTDDRSGAIWKFSSSDEEFKKIKLSTNSTNGFAILPIQITTDDGNNFVSFTELYGNKIGLILPESDSVFEFSPPTNNSGPSGIFIKEEQDSDDNDGYIWFTEALSNKIARYHYDDDKNSIRNTIENASRSERLKKIEEFTPSKQLNSPVGIFIDKKENIWVTEHGSSFIARYNIENDTVFRFATSRYEPQIITLPYWIQSDINDNVWFTEHAGNRIAMFNTTDYTLTEYEIPTRDPKGGYLSNTMSLSVAPDGSIWFTEWTEDKIGVVDPRVSIPFEIIPLNNEINISRGDYTDVMVNINARGCMSIKGNSTSNNTILMLKTSGTETPSGRLFNLTATFDPEKITVPINSGSTVRTAKLTIKTDDSMKPGDYTITVSASDGFVTRSAIIKLYVK